MASVDVAVRFALSILPVSMLLLLYIVQDKAKAKTLGFVGSHLGAATLHVHSPQ